MTRSCITLAAALVAAFASAAASAAPKSSETLLPGAPAVAAPGATQAVTIDTRLWPETAPQGDQIVVALTLDHADGFHTWPAAGFGDLPKEIDEFAIRTAIELKDAPDWAWIASVQWPPLHDSRVADIMNPGKTVVVETYSDQAVAFVTITLAPDAPVGHATLNLIVSWQACDDTTCLAPEDATKPIAFRITERPAFLKDYIPVVSAGVANSGGSTNNSNADPISPNTESRELNTTNQPSTAEPAQAVAPSIFGLELAGTSGFVAILVLFLAAALGGFVLNLMPCVLPVIPIKILTLTKHAGSRQRAMVLGLWTSIGVMFFWTAIGIPVAIFSEAIGDPSRTLFGNWWVAMGIGFLLVLLAIGAMGIFQFKLPQGAYMFNPDPNTPWGSFLFGIMTALLGLPCFGFAAGGLLAPMAVMPTIAILAVFIGIGIGMAVPYFILSAFPQLLSKVPKAGPASDLIKQVMGLLLLAAAAYFVSVGFFQLSADHPWITTNLKWITATVFILLACVWLVVRTIKVSKTLLPVAFGLLIAGALVAFSSMYTYNESRKARINWLVTSGLADDEIITGHWIEYTPGRFETARAQGKVIVIDFTAEWCINCKAYKSAVLDSQTVKDRMDRGDVVTFEGDVTSKTRPAQALMDQWNQTGIPLLAVLAPGSETPQFSNSAPASAVVDMIDRAAGKSIRANRQNRGRPTSPREVAQRR